MQGSRTVPRADGAEGAAPDVILGRFDDDMVDRPAVEPRLYVTHFLVGIDKQGDVTIMPIGVPQEVSSRTQPLPQDGGCHGHLFFECRTLEGVPPVGYFTDTPCRFYYGHRLLPLEADPADAFPFGGVILEDGRIIPLRKDDQVIRRV